MNFPDATQMADAGTAITNAYNAFPILATILAIVIVLRVGPVVIRLVRRAFGGG